jgi:hypothetical protein
MITSLEEGEPRGEASAEFWDLRAKLSVATGAMPSYTDACASLGYSPDEAAAEELPIRRMDGRGTSSVVPNPWTYTSRRASHGRASQGVHLISMSYRRASHTCVPCKRHLLGAYPIGMYLIDMYLRGM